MSLSDRINDKFEQWRQDVTKGVGGLLVTIVGKGLELLLDIVGKAMKPAIMPTIDKLLALPDLPPEVGTILTELKTKDGQWQAALLGGMGTQAIGGASSAAFGPIFRWINNQIEEGIRSQIFDYPIVLSAWLRGEDLPLGLDKELHMMGYADPRIELLKKIVWLRLEPDIVQKIWLRDKGKYESLWKDLHDIGFDDERINVYKELAHIIPSSTDLIRMAVREVFTPEIVQKYGQMEDFPPDFAKWGEKVGLTEEWAKNYWAAHWDLPSPSQGFEMLHRGVISEEDLKVLLRALDVMPYWRDPLIKIAYRPFTRVDVRRMYKVGVLDREGVKRAYLDIGFNDEKAEAMTEFTIAYYAKPTDEAIDKERDLTRSDICTGYQRGLIPLDEATEILEDLGYDPDEITYYLSREDQKAIQTRKDAYASNYRQLYVTGLIDDEVVKADLTGLGFTETEVTDLLQLWYIERVRRVERPSRSDLGRFYKKEIITLERYQAEMAALGWSDDYIALYLKDMED